MSYKNSLNLPKTKFPMKANLTELEPRLLKEWEQMNINEKITKKRKGNDTFILHDGPPYANGHIHLGTTFNKILKDFIVKYKNIRGYNTPYVPGWDCHGMPIEHNVTKNLGEKAKTIDKVILRKKCRYYAEKFVNIQREEFKNLGIFGYWESPYITMSSEYEGTIIEHFGKLVEKGYIHRGKRPVHWCSKCQTALAGNEVEYEDKKAPSIFVKLKLINENKSLLIWTTTPWTLPANEAAAFHPKEKYVEIDTDFGIIIVAEKLKKFVIDSIKTKKADVLSVKEAEYYNGKKYEHPIFPDKKCKVILADFVTMETGSGIVHSAPGHGYEDYQAGLKHDLEIISPVDEAGKFTEYVKQYEGQFVFDANKNILNDLQEKGTLVFNEEIIHSYPICWRCKSELIFRATEQWFLDINHNDLRKRLLDEIDKVKWIPGWSRDRIYNMVTERPDWCLSRQRSWGVPIPVVYCKECGEEVLDKNFIFKIRDLVFEHGADIWFEKDVSELTKGMKCSKCGNSSFEKEEDIFDVWFDSALSHAAVVQKRKELKWPSDLYLEAVDQHRGWFQVALIVSVATEGESPYREVLTHGLILDKNMKKMSKSLGNVINPKEIAKKTGAEIIRLWISSIDYTSDQAFREDSLKTPKDVYFRIRNSFKYILGNLNDFEYSRDAVKFEDMMDIDKYMLARLDVLKEKLFNYYDEYQFHKVFRDFHNFCSNELSSFYFDILKDRLYTYGKTSHDRRSGQTAIFIIMNDLLKLIEPILPFTTEETYSYFNMEKKEESVHLEVIDSNINRFRNKELEHDWQILIKLKDKVNIALENLRNSNTIGKSLEAKILLFTDNKELKNLFEKYSKFLKELFIVSKVDVLESPLGKDPVKMENPDCLIYTEKAEGNKCARCWIISKTVGENEKYPDLCDRCIDVVK